MYTALDRWQNSTYKYEAMALKVKASSLENSTKDAKIFWTNRFSSKGKVSDIEFLATRMKDDDYIKLRAMNQAYMKVRNMRSIKLYRGTDGRTGRVLVDKLISNPESEFTFEDANIAGYTKSKRIARSFGTQKGGLVVTLQSLKRVML